MTTMTISFGGITLHSRVVSRTWYDVCVRLPRDRNDDRFELGSGAQPRTILNKMLLAMMVGEKVLSPRKGPLP